MPPKKEPTSGKKNKKPVEIVVPKELASHFDAQYLQQGIKLFQAMDKKNEGFVDVKELGYMLRLLGGNPTDKEVEDWTEAVKVDKSKPHPSPLLFSNKYLIPSPIQDKMDGIGFLQCAALELETHKTPEDLVVAFQIFDPKDTGTVKDDTIKDSIGNKCINSFSFFIYFLDFFLLHAR